MSERNALLASIAGTIKDYRAGEIEEPTPEHVGRWIKQFDGEVRVPLLRELDHILKHTYFSRKQVTTFLKGLVGENELAGSDPCGYWGKAHFLRIQQNGHSQEELLAIFDEVLQRKCGFTTAGCGRPGGDFIYLDDAMFSGGRVGSDLAAWIQDKAPVKATVHVIAVATHTFAEYKMPQRLDQVTNDQKKKINLKIWRIEAFENKLINRNISEVLWPVELPVDEALKAYLEEEKKFPFKPRSPGGKTTHGIFSSEEGRQLVEWELLLAGLRIRSFCQNPSQALRPLGFSPFGLGFGSMIVTFRNCPNNCPLALWWGDPDADPNHPFSKWYPLLPRKTYATDVDFNVIDF
ncbi:MAG: hypothetical protein QME83_13285 [Thermodesulfobacteriota bacterium]|nr:hypothetical protein [Thermodesulfobacteriota bacterium]